MTKSSNSCLHRAIAGSVPAFQHGKSGNTILQETVDALLQSLRFVHAVYNTRRVHAEDRMTLYRQSTVWSL